MTLKAVQMIIQSTAMGSKASRMKKIFQPTARYLSTSFFCFIRIFRKIFLGTSSIWLYRSDVALKGVSSSSGETRQYVDEM